VESFGQHHEYVYALLLELGMHFKDQAEQGLSTLTEINDGMHFIFLFFFITLVSFFYNLRSSKFTVRDEHLCSVRPETFQHVWQELCGVLFQREKKVNLYSLTLLDLNLLFLQSGEKLNQMHPIIFFA